MNNNSHFFNKIVTLLVVLSLSGQSIAYAQSPQQQDKVRIDYNDATGKVSFIGADPSRPITVRSAQVKGLTADSSARAMISPYAASFGLKNPSSELKLISADQVEDREVTRFQQVYQGVPIMGGEMIVNATDQAELLSLSGEIAPDLALDVNPSISPKQAQLTALQAMAKSHQVSADALEATEPELWIYDSRLLEPDGRQAALVWRLEVKSRDNSLPVNELVLVDAKRGSIVLNYNQIDTTWVSGTARGGVNPTAPRQDEQPTEVPTEEPVATETPVATATPIPTETPVPTEEIQSTPTPEALPTGQQDELQALAATTYYVNGATGNNSWSCTTVAQPCKNIQQAIEKGSTAGDTIKVASGTYTWSNSALHPNFSNVVIIDRGITLSGGWNSGFTTQDGVSIIDGGNTNNGVLANYGTTTIDHFIIQNTTTGDGGGIYIYTSDLTLSSVTLKNNIATGKGAGIYIQNGTLAATNVTISGNGNSGTDYGGGVYVNSGTTTFTNTTIAYNTAMSGGGISDNTGTYTIKNTIIANNTATAGPDCSGTIDTSSYNIVGDTSGCIITAGVGDQLNINPQVQGSLTGTMQVHALFGNSPAINAGTSTGCPATDQRGVSRPQLGSCDIGSYEYDNALGIPTTIEVSSGTPQSAGIFTTFSSALTAIVKDEYGLPLSGVTVTFTAPTSGAGGTFANGSNQTTTTTNASGLATAATFSANGIVGGYTVTASVNGIATPANFSLTNIANTIWYVATTGSDSNNCQSPSTPCLTINGAIAKTNNSDVIYVASGTYINVALINKNAVLRGGWNSDFTAQNGSSIIDGQNSSRPVTVSPGTIAYLQRFTLKNGYSIDRGGGIYNEGNLTLTDSAVVNNTGRNGGGGIYQPDGSLSINNTTIGNNSSGRGGGVYIYKGNLTLTNSAVVNNTAQSGDGGGILHAGSGLGSLNVKNTTISNNSAMGGGGGGVYIWGGDSSFNNVTITQNQAQTDNPENPVDNLGGGISNYYNTPVTIRNSIIAGNVAREMPDCQGSFTSGGNNLIGYLGGCYITAASGDLLGDSGAPLNAKLGNLADNGGGTLTHALLVGSPAIDAGNPAKCETTDQRGVTRPQGPACDMGAFEGSASQSISAVIKTYTAANGTSLPGTLLCDQTSPNCTNGANPDADKAHRFALEVYQFYVNKHSRQGIDDNNMPIISTVHYDSNFYNAFWDGAQMVYGDGYSGADDVVGHELTHGVTQYESNLFYYYQSGAISESFSDLWGELYDQQNGLGNDSANVKWLHGEDLPGGANRSMSNPPTYSDPDKMTSAYYYSDAADNGGVHINSGINNKAAYLLVDGGTFNGRTVSAIGTDKTLTIYYEVQANLLTSGADYADLYNALYQGCLNLIGGSSGIVFGDCQQVRNATDAVEMSQKPAAVGFNTDPSLCGTGLMPSYTFKDDLEGGTSNWTITNGSTTRWQYDSPYGTYAHSGTHFLYADDYPAAVSLGDVRLKPITIPTNGYLYFYHAYDFEYYTNDPYLYDGGVLQYSTNGGSTWSDAGSLIEVNGYPGVIYPNWNNPLAGYSAFVWTSHGYIGTRVNLSSLAGQSVVFRWLMGLDDWGYRGGWWLDDVQVYQCIPASPSVVSITRVNTSPSNAANVDFTVTFSEPVTGVNMNAPFSDFYLTTTGITGASITGVTGSGTTYTVSVNTGTGEGTIRLDVLDNDTILGGTGDKLGGPGFNNGNFNSGEVYAIDTAAPTVASINRAGGNPSSASSVNFTVTFSEPVTGVDAVTPFNDFALTTSGVSGAAISNVSGSGKTYTVTVNTGVNTSPDNGSIRLDVPASAVAADLAGNVLGGLPYVNGAAYTISKPPTAATLTSPTGNIGKEYDPIYQWNKVATASRYHLYVSGPKGTVSDLWFEAANICDDTVCSVTLGPSYTLSGGTHTWYIQTYNSAGNGPWSAAANFNTTVPTPPVAADLRDALTIPAHNAALGTNYAPTFTWKKVDTATYYHLYIAGPTGTVLDQWYQSSAICNATSCSVSGVSLGGGNHTWYVQTYNSAGIGPWSEATNFSTTVPTAPPAVDLRDALTTPAHNAALGTNYTPTFAWKKVDTATYYHVYIAGPTGAVLDQWYQSSAICNATSCSVSGITLGGGAHTWYVQTYNSAGYGPWSEATNFSTTVPTAPPAVDLRDALTTPAHNAALGTNYTPTFAWKKVDTATYYHVYIAGPTGAVLDQWYQSSAICNATTCSVTGVTLGGGAHTWYVQTYNSAGIGPWSEATNFSNTVPTAPPAVDLRDALTTPAHNAALGTNYTPTFVWKKIDTATYYHVYIAGPTGVILDQWYQSSAICNATSCSVSGITLGGGAHTWYVQTYNSAGIGPWSEATNFSTTVPTAPPAVDLRDALTTPAHNATLGTNYTPTFTWKKVDTATYYHLYIAGPTGAVLDQWYQASTICNSTSCSVSGITLGGGAHTWYVQTYNSAGYGPWSEATNFSTTVPTAPPAVDLRDVLTIPAHNATLGTNYTPTFTWKKVDTATYYRFNLNGPSGLILDQWYQASTICNATSCSVSGVTLGGGAHIWYVQTYNSAGVGPWSEATSFSTTPPTTPPGAVLTAPTGTIATLTPAFTWNKVNTATWYHLYVKGPYGMVKDQWYQGVNICNDTTCSVTDINLTDGDHVWWVQTYNAVGYGPWTKGTFTINP